MQDLREIRTARFQWGQPVVAATDLYNDGSVPEAPEDIMAAFKGVEKVHGMYHMYKT